MPLDKNNGTFGTLALVGLAAGVGALVRRGSRSRRDGTVVERVGDVDPLTYGGGTVFEDDDGGFTLEYTYGPTDDEDYEEDDENYEHTVYRVDLHQSLADFLAYNDWADLDDVGRSVGATAQELRQCSETTLGRARLAEDIAGYYGWENFDNYPIEFTTRELLVRWELE